MGEPGGAVVVVDVRAGVEEALGVHRRTGDWWPVAAYSVEPGRVETVVLEGRAEGCCTSGVGGDEADWGQVLAWEPPARCCWPGRPAPTGRPRPRWRSASPRSTPSTRGSS